MKKSLPEEIAVKPVVLNSISAFNPIFDLLLSAQTRKS